MSDLRESIGGFLGSSTVQVRDSSPSVQNDDAVEAILVPEGEVTFSQEVLDEDGVTMQNVQLVGDNLVLMDGDVIVSEQSGAILVQHGMYVDAEQMEGQVDQMIAYIPESVPDQGQSLVVDESEIGIHRAEDSIQGEEGIYETNAAVPVGVVPQAEDQRIEEVPAAPQHPEESQAVLVGFTVRRGEIEEVDGATYVEVESDRILLQEVPEQMTAMIVERMEIDTVVPSQDERLQEMPLAGSDEQQVQETCAIEDPGGPEQEAAAAAERHAGRPGFQVIRPAVQPMLYDEGSVQNQRDRATGDAEVRDQELQVVPDSSATVPSKAFLSENLHESMDGSTERISPAVTMGIQMVPSSGENSRDTMVTMHREEALLQDTIYAPAASVSRSGERTGHPGHLDEPEDAGSLGSILVWRRGEEAQQEESRAETEFLQSHRLDEVEEAPPLSQNETSEEELAQMVDVPDERIILVEDTQNVTRVFRVAEAQAQERVPSDEEAVEHGYEVCIALPDDRDAAVANFPGETGGRTITVPINIGGQVQEIPIQIPDWADLTQQSLVAVTEDGTQIPLTFVQEDEEQIGEGQEDEEEEQHIEVHLDSEMLAAASRRCVPPTESELVAMQDGESGMILAQDGENRYEVINVMDPHEYEIHNGVIRLVQSGNSGGGQTLQRLEVDGDISPATSVTPFYFDGSGMAIHEQSILPDNPEEERTNVIQIPEDAYLSGQSIELQMVEVPGSRVLQKAVGRGGTARGMVAPRGAQRKRRPYRRHAPRQPRRSQSAVGAVESQKAVRSIGQPNVAADDLQSAPPNEQQYIAIQEGMPSAAQDAAQVELCNETPSVISPENMQALIQVLQSLPNNARGRTIQIVLQGDQFARSTSPDEDLALATISETAPDAAAATALPQKSNDQQIKAVRVLQRQVTPKSTSDIAIQVTPNFLEGSSVTPTDSSTTLLPKTTTITVLAEDIMPQSCINEPVEDDSFLFGGGKISKKQKPPATKKKAAPKKIVTVEEVQYMMDAKPGVSYYAVVDYMSEHDQDGFSSASEMRRPEAQYSGFMEDHLELQSTSDQTKGRSILESTLDSSVTVTPHQYQRRKHGRGGPPAVAVVSQPQQDDGAAIDLPLETDQSSVTLRERTYEQAMLEEDLGSAQPTLRHARHRRRSRMRASRPVMERYEHRCGYCEFGSTDKILVVEHCIGEHPEQPVKTLSLLPQMSGRMCPYCLQSFDHMEFFAHMRFAHNEVHPFKCGYCEFMGRDRNQVRHHIQKKHRLPMKVINLLDSNRRPEDTDSRYGGSGGTGTGKKRIMAYSEGEDTVYEYLTDEEEMEDNDSDNANAKRDLVCPECKRAFKTLKYLKTHIKIHQSLRYQCSYCDFISVMLHQVIRHCQKKHVGMAPKVLTKELDPDKYAVVSRDMESVIEKVFALNTRLPRDPDAAKWMRKWFCPHCDYACQFGASYRRHLRMHANILPYKCNYCSFKGREKYYVRRHIHRMHKDLPMIVVENNPENCARDTSSDEDYQEKGLRRRRRRRTKDAEHAVVPLGHLEDELLGPHFQKLPVGERGTRGSRLAIDELENEFPLDNVMRLGGEDIGGGYRSRSAGIQRLSSRSQLWSEENLDDYIEEQVGDIIVCKICGERTHEKVFHKHARKHFKLRPLKCGYCNYMSMEMSKIRAHNNLKHPGAPLKLEECHLASITPEDFMDLLGGDDEVMAAAAGDAQENDPLTAHFECPFCQATLAYTERCLQEHFYTHYDYYPFKCSECDFQATSEQKVVEHGASHDAEIIVYQIEMDKPAGLEETIQQFLKEGEQIAAQRVNELLEQSAMPRLAAAADDKGGLEGEASSGLTVSIFQCPVCDQQMTLHEVMVRRHLYEHYDHKPFCCGHCGFRGVSKGSIKQHSAVHGPVRPRIGLSEEAMPEDLAKILRHIRSVMKLSPEKMESAVIPNEETVRLAADNEDPLTTEGRRWKEALTRGQCPWCDAQVAGGGSKLHTHLLGHFSTRPFQCGRCGERFSGRREAGRHAIRCHPDEEPKVVEIIDDEAEMRKGLLQFMKSKRTSVGARSLMENTSVGEEKAPADGQDVLAATIEDEVKKLMGEGKEFQYQVVILNEDGTVVETMEVMAQQPVSEAGPVVEGGEELEARDVPTPPISEDAGNGVGMEEPPNAAVEIEAEKTVTVANQVPDAAVEIAAKKTATAANQVPGVEEESAEQMNGAEAEPRNAETGHESSVESVAEDPETETAEVGRENETQERNTVADGTLREEEVDGKKVAGLAGKVQAAAEPDNDDDDDEPKEERDDFDAEIVTVDRVLLTRSFRSETEDSGDDDNLVGSAMSPAGSSDNGSVNSNEDDDDDEMLAIGPSLEFMGDIISLLKNSSVALRAEKPPKVYKFMCQHCGVTFPRSATLQKHIAREHEREDEVEDEDADGEKATAHEFVAPETSEMAWETPNTSAKEEVPLRGTKRDASEATDSCQEKRAKTSPEGEQNSMTSATRGQKRSAPGGEGLLPEEKRAKIAPAVSSDPSSGSHFITDVRDAKISATESDDGRDEATVKEASPLQMKLGESEEEEETIENITKMVLEGESSILETTATQREVDGRVAAIEAPLPEEQTDVVQPSGGEPVENPSAHKSAPSRLEASKSENLKKMMEQEVAADLIPSGPCAVKEEPVPSTPAAEATCRPQDLKCVPSPLVASTVGSKPSRLEAYKLEALRRAQSATASADETTASKPPAEEARTLPPKATRKSSRVTRLSKRARRFQESSAVQVGKYKLRGKARKDEAAPAASKNSKTGRAAAAKSPTKAKTDASAATKPRAATPKAETKKKMGPKPKETEPSTSQPPAQSEETAADKINPEEELENLEECDENLPKLLQILQLRPTKDQDKV